MYLTSSFLLFVNLRIYPSLNSDDPSVALLYKVYFFSTSKSSVEIAIGAPLDGYFCWQLTNHSSMSYQLYELTGKSFLIR